MSRAYDGWTDMTVGAVLARPYAWPPVARWTLVAVGLAACTGLVFVLGLESRPFLPYFPLLSAVLLLLRWREGVVATGFVAVVGGMLDVQTGTDPLGAALFGALIIVASGGSIACAMDRVRALLKEKDRLLDKERVARADAEEALAWVREAQAVRAEFISRAAHSLKTPITVMSGYAQLLTEGASPFSSRYPYPPDVREALAAIVRQGAVLDALYRQLLDVAATAPEGREPPERIPWAQEARTGPHSPDNPWAAPAAPQQRQGRTEPPTRAGPVDE